MVISLMHCMKNGETVNRGAGEKLPLVSIVVVARNEAKNMNACLESLEALAYPKERVDTIVVDDGSTDGTASLCEKRRCRVLRTCGVGPSRARNLGIQAARGELVAFTDADCVVRSDWLTELVGVCLEEEAASVGGDQDLHPLEGSFGREVQAFLSAMGFFGGYTKSRGIVRPVLHNPTCNVLYRREALLEAGGFDEALWPGEDLDLDLRLHRMDFRAFYNPRAVVAHKRPDTLRSFARMMYRYGKFAGGILTRRYGLFRLLCAEPLLLFLAAGGAIGLLVWLPAGAFALLGGLLLAAALLGSRFRSAGSKRPWLSLLLLLVTLGAWNLGYCAGFFSHQAKKPRTGFARGSRLAEGPPDSLEQKV